MANPERLQELIGFYESNDPAYLLERIIVARKDGDSKEEERVRKMLSALGVTVHLDAKKFKKVQKRGGRPVLK